MHNSELKITDKGIISFIKSVNNRASKTRNRDLIMAIAIIEKLLGYKQRRIAGDLLRNRSRSNRKPRKRKKFPHFRKGTPHLDRIMAMVYKEKRSGCLIWMGNGTHEYGMIYVSEKRKNVLVHRLMVEIRDNITLGPQDIVMHTCDNTWCVNPDHLRVGTSKENRRDCIVKGRTGRGVDIQTAKTIKIRYLKGESAYALSRELGMAKSSIQNIVFGEVFKELDDDPEIKAIPRLTRQERMSSLKEDDVRQIRIMLADGVPRREIADSFGVKTWTINNIAVGRNWSHIS